MPMFRGFWLNIHTGKAIEVAEHAAHVNAHPETFGLSRADIAATGFKGGEGEVREIVVRMAMKKGWIRVRQHRQDYVFEHEWDDLFDVYGAVVSFLKDHKTLVYPHDELRVIHVGKHTGFHGTAQQFLDSYEPKKGTGIGFRPEMEPGSRGARVFDLIRQHIYQQAGIVGDSEIPYDKKLDIINEVIETIRAQG